MVKEKLLNLWSENVGCVVLYSWYDFLKESLVSFLGISEVLDLSEMVSKHQALNEKQKIHTEETKSPEIQPDLSTPTCSAQNLKEENIRYKTTDNLSSQKCLTIGCSIFVQQRTQYLEAIWSRRQMARVKRVWIYSQQWQ